MTTFFLYPPDYYGIEYEINPWMRKEHNSHSDLADQQWQALYTLLRETLLIRIEQIAPVRGLPDIVFTANAGMVVGNLFIGSRFRHDVRQEETVHYEKWFQDHQFELILPPVDVHFEGEGDALWVGETLFLGYGIRTDASAAPWLSKVLDRSVIGLELVDPRFYHLDTCFCPLDERRVLYYPPAFSTSAQQQILKSISNPIAIEEQDALRFGANAIVIKNQIVMNTGCVSLTRTLSEEGFTVHPLDFSEFIKAGGSAKCLILQLGEME
jgi:N-dimethylarginine dimethylaminohydrolase